MHQARTLPGLRLLVGLRLTGRVLAGERSDLGLRKCLMHPYHRRPDPETRGGRGCEELRKECVSMLSSLGQVLWRSLTKTTSKVFQSNFFLYPRIQRAKPWSLRCT